MTPIRCLLVDDEPPARRKLRRLLAPFPHIDIVGEADGAEAAIAAAKEVRPDLLFLDIHMPDGDGFHVLAELGDDLDPCVIFLTAHDQYALRAFEFRAFDYLLKPISPPRFDAVMRRVLEHMALLRQEAPPASRFLTRVLVPLPDRSFFLPIGSVDLLEAERNYVRLHGRQTSYLIRGTLEGFAASLDPAHFVQVNRSAVVRLAAISQVTPLPHGEYRLLLPDGRELVWSRRFAKRAAAALLQRC